MILAALKTKNMTLPLFALGWLSMSLTGDKTDKFNLAAPLTERSTEQ
jgi:hypothetical protein